MGLFEREQPNFQTEEPITFWNSMKRALPRFEEGKFVGPNPPNEQAQWHTQYHEQERAKERTMLGQGAKAISNVIQTVRNGIAGVFNTGRTGVNVAFGAAQIPVKIATKLCSAGVYTLDNIHRLLGLPRR